MKHLPPLGGLRAFEAAARHLSFKLAAEELGVTPTAISHQIRQVELYCGQSLFRRRPRPIALTPAGEQLFPVLRDGFESFLNVLTAIEESPAVERLRVTATNAFAARWLVPRLPLWRALQPRIKLDIIGTDAVLDLRAGDADVAIRYARVPPAGVDSIELCRDNFHVVASPRLVGRTSLPLDPTEIGRYALIEAEWLPNDTMAPTWSRWQAEAATIYPDVPDLAGLVSMNFREELHAIEAVIAGHGIGLCSDVLAAAELGNGSLVKLSDLVLPGYGFYLVSRASHQKGAAIRAFLEWAQSLVGTSQ
jgi:LysR family transcriptional regulator, glycine cleavage system transcriptional activator